MAKNQKDTNGIILEFFRILFGFVPLILIFVFGLYSFLYLYAIIGVILFIVTRYLKLSNSKNWLSDLSFSLILWPMMLSLWKDFFKKEKKTYMDKFNEAVDKFPELKKQMEYFEIMSKNGTTEDVIPNGRGRFGYDVTNPIPTNNYMVATCT